MLSSIFGETKSTLQKTGHTGYRCKFVILEDSAMSICVVYKTCCVLFAITILHQNSDIDGARNCFFEMKHDIIIQ